MKKINVLLAKDVPGLGKEGEVKQVSSGYFQNLLLPTNAAVILTKELEKQLERGKAHAQEKREQKLLNAEKMKREIEQLEISFTLKSAKGGTFGSITRQLIYEKLKEKIPALEKEAVCVPHPLKGIGDHEVEIDFGNGIKAKLRVAVLPEEEPSIFAFEEER